MPTERGRERWGRAAGVTRGTAMCGVQQEGCRREVAEVVMD